jgi:5-oxoprolinase (ATP-hydrolysing)
METTAAGVTILAPQLDIHTVAAGGSSRLFFRNGLFIVGPGSAGSEPGPICYRKPGGLLTVTDANLFLGRISLAYFPKIFGKNEDESLDLEATRSAFQSLTCQINEEMKTTMSEDDVALGFLKVCNENMSQKILSITQAKGFDVQQHTLASFGGAGAQHAVFIARKLGIRKVVVHRLAPILSAYGLFLASVVHEEQSPRQVLLTETSFQSLLNDITDLQAKVKLALESKGFDQIEYELFFNLRYDGTDTDMMVPLSQNNSSSLIQEFERAYIRQFGFKLDRSIMVDDLRVRGSGRNCNADMKGQNFLDHELDQVIPTKIGLPPLQQYVFFENEGRIMTPVYVLQDLHPGNIMEGPALLVDRNSTIVLPIGTSALFTPSAVIIEVDLNNSVGKPQIDPSQCDPIQVSLFGHRFMHIAEQAGVTLQKTAISTNIKERLDFSCGILQ